jgi:hypothetical protein
MTSRRRRRARTGRPGPAGAAGAAGRQAGLARPNRPTRSPRPRWDRSTAAATIALVAAVAVGTWLAGPGGLFSPPAADQSQGLAWQHREIATSADNNPVEPTVAVPVGSGYEGICDGVDSPSGSGYCVSSDGLTWSADWPGWLPADSVPSSIAKGSLGYVVVGSADVAGTIPAAFFSADGISWAAASVSSLAGSSSSTGAGLVAIGSGPTTGDETAPQTGSLALWRSDDGRSWTGLAAPAADQGTLFSTGTAYLLGTTIAPAAGQLPLWRSDDGQTWRRVSGAGSAGIVGVDDMVRLADGSLLATAHLDPDTTPADKSMQQLLRSTDDGQTWSVVSVASGDKAMPLGQGIPATLTRAGDVLLGLDFSPVVDDQTVAVSSDGGQTWAPLAVPEYLGSGGEGTYDAPVPLGQAVFVGQTFFDTNTTTTVFWVGRPGSATLSNWTATVAAGLAVLVGLTALGYLLWRWRPGGL